MTCPDNMWPSAPNCRPLATTRWQAVAAALPLQADLALHQQKLQATSQYMAAGSTPTKRPASPAQS